VFCRQAGRHPGRSSVGRAVCGPRNVGRYVPGEQVAVPGGIPGEPGTGVCSAVGRSQASQAVPGDQNGRGSKGREVSG